MEQTCAERKYLLWQERIDQNVSQKKLNFYWSIIISLVLQSSHFVSGITSAVSFKIDITDPWFQPCALYTEWQDVKNQQQFQGCMKGACVCGILGNTPRMRSCSLCIADPHTCMFLHGNRGEQACLFIMILLWILSTLKLHSVFYSCVGIMW